ncbi:MAG: eukaryotic translation initiation factor 3 subunit D, partial [Olpidium bornovanus]
KKKKTFDPPYPPCPRTALGLNEEDGRTQEAEQQKETRRQRITMVNATVNSEESDVKPRFHLQTIVDNVAGGWGPNQDLLPPEFRDVPYAPFSKGDKLGRIADWVNPDPATMNFAGQAGYAGNFGREREGGRRYGRNYKDSYQAYGSAFASTFAYNHAEDEASFSVVDTRSTVVKRGVFGRTAGRGRGRGGFRGGFRGGVQRLGGGWGGRGGFSFRDGRRRFGWKDYDKPQRVRDASIAVGADWIVLEEMDFARLSKLSYEEPDVEDLDWHGQIHYYDKLYDRVTVKAEKPLLLAGNTSAGVRERFNATTSDDPVIQYMAGEGDRGTVFATDSILACLMTTTRSVYPWDIVVTRTGNKLFFDKRDGSNIDYLTVNENAVEPPAEADDKDNINSATALSIEATLVNEKFLAQAVKELFQLTAYVDPTLVSFQDDFVELSSKPYMWGNAADILPCGYRYRSWYLGDESCVLVARTELSSALKPASASSPEVRFVLKALNEYDHKAAGAGGALSWRQKLDTQRGAVLATEMKNNANKLARWACEAALAGADHIRVGFMSRLNARDNSRHSVIGSQSYRPAELATQLNFSFSSGWGIVKTITDVCFKQPEGKYILVKDPNK